MVSTKKSLKKATEKKPLQRFAIPKYGVSIEAENMAEAVKIAEERYGKPEA